MLIGPIILAMVGGLAFSAGCESSQRDWDGVMPHPGRAVMTPEIESKLTTILDDFHDAAAKADGSRYFGHFAPDAVFLGTDATERWTLGEFKKFAEPYFSKGKGWTYRLVPGTRHFLASDWGAFAFDELLDNDKLGRCRGSGVIVWTGSRLQIQQYNLTMTVPNEIAEDVAKQSRSVLKEPK